jgi:hypothetical protein
MGCVHLEDVLVDAGDDRVEEQARDAVTAMGRCDAGPTVVRARSVATREHEPDEAFAVVAPNESSATYPLRRCMFASASALNPSLSAAARSGHVTPLRGRTSIVTAPAPQSASTSFKIPIFTEWSRVCGHETGRSNVARTVGPRARRVPTRRRPPATVIMKSRTNFPKLPFITFSTPAFRHRPNGSAWTIVPDFLSRPRTEHRRRRS